jgi:hypothetical protein
MVRVGHGRCQGRYPPGTIRRAPDLGAPRDDEGVNYGATRSPHTLRNARLYIGVKQLFPDIRERGPGDVTNPIEATNAAEEICTHWVSTDATSAEVRAAETGV